MLKNQIIYTRVQKLFQEREPSLTVDYPTRQYHIYADNKGYILINSMDIKTIINNIINDEDDDEKLGYLIHRKHIKLYEIISISYREPNHGHYIIFHTAKTGKPTLNDLWYVYTRHRYIQSVLFRFTSDTIYIIRPIKCIIRQLTTKSEEDIKDTFLSIDRTLPDKEYIEACRQVGIDIQIIDCECLEYILKNRVKLKIQD